ncbi:L-tyrosine/L-tryptophan isonitrile synthase family protein [Micromonospora sp. NPDC050397]|uniref:L-tyrosine/L-tryptophan isonitrile synthase family protein n=1 Tax=Micromonospora sp. NPDC050397 TaxID=3364279 RepID=UPI0038506CB2
MLTTGADPSWPELRRILRADPMLRLYATCPPTRPPAGTPLPSALVPDHPSVVGGSGTVSASALARTPGLARTVLTHPSLDSSDTVSTLVEYLLRPMLRVFRTSLDRYGWALVDPGEDVLFELASDGAPTGRVVVADLPPAALPSPGRDARPGLPAAVTALATAGAAVARTDPASVTSRIAPVVATELRFLRPATARLLRADPRWARYAHAVPEPMQAAVRRIVDLLRSTRASAGGDGHPPPVVRVPRSPGDAEPAGLPRLRQEIFHLGGDLRELTGDQRELTGDLRELTGDQRELTGDLRELAAVTTFERTPDTWRLSKPEDPPALSYVRSVASLPIGELRRNPLAARYAVRWTAAQTDALVDRLLAEAKGSAARTAENAVASRGHADRRLPAVERQARLVHHVFRRRQFKLGSGTEYPAERAVRDLAPTISRGEPIRLTLMCFATKFSHSQLKAPGPMPDLADLAMLVRLTELVGALRQVYPPGARLTLVIDGEHFRAHPRLPLREGLDTRFRYAEAVGADFLEIRDYEDLIDRRIDPVRRRAHAEFAERVRHDYRRAFEGLDLAADPLTELRRAGAADPHGNFVSLFRSLVHSVPVPPPVGMPMLAWSQSVYADLYEVHERVPTELRRARRELLRTTWDDTLEYLSAWHADRRFGYRDRIVPGAVALSVRPARDRLGLSLLGGASIPPWHATGVVDARGTISCDFHISLHDQGFVPLHSPLLGPAQPFAMVPVTAVRLAPSGTELELDPDLVARIGLRRR